MRGLWALLRLALRRQLLLGAVFLLAVAGFLWLGARGVAMTLCWIHGLIAASILQSERRQSWNMTLMLLPVRHGLVVSSRYLVLLLLPVMQSLVYCAVSLALGYPLELGEPMYILLMGLSHGYLLVFPQRAASQELGSHLRELIRGGFWGGAWLLLLLFFVLCAIALGGEPEWCWFLLVLILFFSLCLVIAWCREFYRTKYNDWR